MSDVRPEEDAFFRVIEAIDKVVTQVKDTALIRETLLRASLHLNARIEQNQPTGDWLD